MLLGVVRGAADVDLHGDAIGKRVLPSEEVQKPVVDLDIVRDEG